jgi:hypothetical protein
MLMSLVIAAGFVYLCVIHIIDFISKGTNYKQMCDTFYPCGFFYSRFSQANKFAYAATMLLFAISSFFIILYQWLRFDVRQQTS